MREYNKQKEIRLLNTLEYHSQWYTIEREKKKSKNNVQLLFMDNNAST